MKGSTKIIIFLLLVIVIAGGILAYQIFTKQNIWITICAIILAIPLGNFMTDFIFKNATGDTYDFSADINISSFVISAICIFTVSYIVNKFLAKKVRKIDMVTSLKANE